MKRIVFVVLCLGVLGACSKPTMRLDAEVMKISGTLPQILSSTGALFGNDSVKLGVPSLVLTLKESNGHIRTLEVLDSDSVTKAALFTRLCIGSKVSYTVTLTGESKEKLALDPLYHTGKVYADDLLVPEPCSR